MIIGLKFPSIKQEVVGQVFILSFYSFKRNSRLLKKYLIKYFDILNKINIKKPISFGLINIWWFKKKKNVIIDYI